MTTTETGVVVQLIKLDSCGLWSWRSGQEEARQGSLTAVEAMLDAIDTLNDESILISVLEVPVSQHDRVRQRLTTEGYTDILVRMS